MSNTTHECTECDFTTRVVNIETGEVAAYYISSCPESGCDGYLRPHHPNKAQRELLNLASTGGE